MRYSVILCASWGLVACARKIPYPIVDTHAHVDLFTGAADLGQLTTELSDRNFSHIFLMETPNPSLNASGSQISNLLAFGASHAALKYFYGGGDLNPIVHALGRPDGATLTTGSLYPNGGGSDADAATIRAIAADAGTYTTQFQTNATAAANSGKYIGFGELSPYHASRRSGHPFIEFAANHALMKWLADLAAARNMVIDVHIEAVGQKMAEFADLLAHNRSAKIIWQHAGWSETGGSTAELYTQMLESHSNLYLGIKLRPPTTREMGYSSVFDENGRIKEDWVVLLKKYPQRIMVGTDAKFFQDGKSAGSGMIVVQALLAELLLQLPASVSEAIASRTASELFGL